MPLILKNLMSVPSCGRASTLSFSRSNFSTNSRLILSFSSLPARLRFGWSSLLFDFLLKTDSLSDLFTLHQAVRCHDPSLPPSHRWGSQMHAWLANCCPSPLFNLRGLQRVRNAV